MTQLGKKIRVKAGIEPRSVALEADALPLGHRLAGLVVKASTSRAEDLGFESRLRRDFSGVESYQ